MQQRHVWVLCKIARANHDDPESCAAREGGGEALTKCDRDAGSPADRHEAEAMLLGLREILVDAANAIADVHVSHEGA